MRTRVLSILSMLCFVPYLALAQTLDPSTYALTGAAAEQFVRATQQMVASGGPGPNMQGNAMDLQRVKADIDRNPAAQQALAAAGLSSTDYVLFLGAAIHATMVGQMEQGGMRGVLPPGVAKRPSQENIDFMKQNMDIFTRSMTPGAPVTANTRANAAPGIDDRDLPVPADAGSVWPSAILGQIPPLTSITASTQCELAPLHAIIDRETAKARQLQAASYGNPGDAGLARTRAEGEVLERASDSELVLCGQLTNFVPSEAFLRAGSAKDNELAAIANEAENAWNACPGIPGGKEPACERAAAAAAAAKTDAAERRYLAAANDPFAATIAQMQACNVKREAIVRDAKAANVIGANVKDVLQPLVAAWELPPIAVAHWTEICEDAQRYLQR